MIKLAFKNIFRNKKRTIITLILIIFSSFLITFLRFFSYGSHEETIKSAVQLKTGYLQVAANGWLKNKPIDKALEVSDKFLSSLKVKGVKEISPRIFGQGLISYKTSTKFLSIISADSEKEKKITTLHSKIKEGRIYSNKIKNTKIRNNVIIYEAIIGQNLSKSMGIKLNSIASIVSSQYDGSVGAVMIKIVGIYKSDDAGLDTSFVFMNLKAGNELFGLSNNDITRYSSLAISVKNYKEAEKVYNQLVKLYPKNTSLKTENTSAKMSSKSLDISKLSNSLDDDMIQESKDIEPVIHSWQELIPGVLQLVWFDQISGEFTFAFLILIMAFGVLSAIQMSIYERKNEFGILIAIGTKGSQLVRLVMTETFFILIPGLILGALFGILLGYYFEVNPIILTGEYAKMSIENGFAPVLRCIVDAKELWIALLSLGIPSLLFSFFTSIKILKMNPVDSIKEVA